MTGIPNWADRWQYVPKYWREEQAGPMNDCDSHGSILSGLAGWENLQVRLGRREEMYFMRVQEVGTG